MKDISFHFRTLIHIPESTQKISYKENLVLIGSCFSENIGKKLIQSKFSVKMNPFGILYNPISIKQTLERLRTAQKFEEKELTFSQQHWFSFHHHSQFSHENAAQCLQQINFALEQGNQALKKADFLFLTLGSAWVFESNESQKIVANCHKQPAKEFSHYCLKPARIVEEYATLLTQLKTFNPQLKVIFTVSPVRHWKEGPMENQRSKSTLFVAIYELKEKFPFVDYFPSYELMMDDLRDYRFYESDMLHPNSVALDYIWEHFLKTYMETETLQILNKIQAIQKATNHKPFKPNSKAHQKFIAKQIALIETLEKNHPFLNLEKEKQELNP